jgi:tetratricopeptide (TPR) repeat protein
MDQEKNRWWIWSAVIVVVLLAVAATAWFGRSAYKNYKERRSQAQAQAFLAKGDFRSAVLSARQALQLNPTNVPACRIMAASADLSHSPTMLDWQRRIVLTEPTIENKLLLASSSLRYQSFPFPLATQILDELTPAATNLASYQVVAASLALSLRRLDEAENHFETATKLDPTNQLYELNLAILRLGSTNATKVVPSRAVLENLRSDANLGPPALRALVVDRIMHRDAAGAENFSTQLVASAQATVADRLQHLGILRQRQSADFAIRLQAVQQSAVTNALAVAEVAAWMQANNLLAEDLRWLTNLPAGLQSQPAIRLSLANGYLQSADWTTLRDFASKGNWEEMEFLRLALVARAWSQLDMKQMAESNWAAAVNAAGSRFGALTTLLGLTEQWKLPHEREALLQWMIEKFPRERWAQHALEELYLAAGDTANLQQLYAKLFAVFPQDIGLKNNLAATCLLLKTNLPLACKWAEEVYAGRTNDLIVASTYAFALHLQGRTPDGLAVLRKLDDRLLRQPDAALYYAVLLAATGATNEAAPYLKIARTKTQWLPEEKRLLSKAAGEF